MSIYDYAAITGAIFWVVIGGLMVISLLVIVWWLLGWFGAYVFKRLRRVYHLTVIGYWLDRLEKEGSHCFPRPGKGES